MKCNQLRRLGHRALAIMLGAITIWGLVSVACAQEKTVPTSATVAPVQALRPGDRVAFFGDSITAQDLYTTFVANHYMAFRPEMKIEFKNAGVGGDQLAQGIARIDRDLVPFKPTVITCCFGMNDAGYVKPDDPKVAENLDKYKAQYAKMLDLLKEKCPDARIVLLTTTVVAPVNPNLAQYNEVLAKFSAFVRQLGKERGLQVVELYTPMLEFVKQAGSRLIPDGVHPNAAGHFLMAELILRAFGELPLAAAK